MSVNVEFIPLTHDHARIVFEWQCDPQTRRYFKNPQPPEWEDHEGWIDKMIVSPCDHIFILRSDDAFSGMLRGSLSEDRNGLEISILIAPKLYGKGIASAALAKLGTHFVQDIFWAEIHTDNHASKRVFEKVGFCRNQQESKGVWLRYEKV